jgi:transposase
MLTPGQAHDLIENADPEALIGDKAYDSDQFVDTLTQRKITPVIPPKENNRKVQRACDFALYCERNLVKRFFNALKHFRAIATRYDKLARNFSPECSLPRLQSCSTEDRPKSRFPNQGIYGNTNRQHVAIYFHCPVTSFLWLAYWRVWPFSA